MQKQTSKQALYLEEVLRLHREKGYGENRISRILPIGHATVSRWIRIFASEKELNQVPMGNKQSNRTLCEVASPAALFSLQEEIKRLQSQLDRANLRADAYEKMIEIAESKFNIPIRKKAVAKR